MVLGEWMVLLVGHYRGVALMMFYSTQSFPKTLYIEPFVDQCGAWRNHNDLLGRNQPHLTCEA